MVAILDNHNCESIGMKVHTGGNITQHGFDIVTCVSSIILIVGQHRVESVRINVQEK
jgi:hypothetical protein